MGPDGMLSYYAKDRGKEKHLGVIDVRMCKDVRIGADCKWKTSDTKVGVWMLC